MWDRCWYSPPYLLRVPVLPNFCSNLWRVTSRFTDYATPKLPALFLVICGVSFGQRGHSLYPCSLLPQCHCGSVKYRRWWEWKILQLLQTLIPNLLKSSSIGYVSKILLRLRHFLVTSGSPSFPFSACPPPHFFLSFSLYFPLGNPTCCPFSIQSFTYLFAHFYFLLFHCCCFIL